MKQPLEVDARRDLVRALKQCHWRSWFEEMRKQKWSQEEAIRRSVGANTFRYFRGTRQPPSVVFRAWAQRAIDRGLAEKLCECETQKDFDRMLRRTTGSLQREWLRAMKEPMDVGPAIKLPSLLLKHVGASPLVPTTSFATAVRHLHVPLDSYTLADIRPVHNSGNGKRCEIPRNAGMGWVPGWREYKSIQATIRECAEEAGVPAIAFDVLAWNLAHCD